MVLQSNLYVTRPLSAWTGRGVQVSRSRFTVDKNWLDDVNRKLGAEHGITNGAIFCGYPFHGGDGAFIGDCCVLTPYYCHNLKNKRGPRRSQEVFLGNIDEDDVSVA